MFSADLAGIVVAPYHSYFNVKRNVSSSASRIRCFSKSFGNKKDGTYMPKLCARHLGYLFRYLYYVFVFIKIGDFIFKHFTLFLVYMRPIAYCPVCKHFFAYVRCWLATSSVKGKQGNSSTKDPYWQYFISQQGLQTRDFVFLIDFKKSLSLISGSNLIVSFISGSILRIHVHLLMFLQGG